jgi:tol-pal system protein YbgF
MYRWRFLAPVAAMAVTGCLASRADILLLQDEIRTLRAMEARTDSARRASADSTARMQQRQADSLRALSQRFGAFQANVGGELFEIGRQLITIQELTGLSSKRLMDLRSSMDERAQSALSADTSGPPPAPTPAILFTNSYEQMQRGSTGTARSGFEELLRRYPNFESASTAQLHVGSCYETEKKYAEADSVYLVVVSKYPRTSDAPTALFKHAMLRQRANKNADAREALQKLIREYPRSVEAEFAATRLPNIKP